MKYDVIIIGGGESGLTKGTQLAKEGKSVVIISFGQSTILTRHAAKDLANYSTRLKEGLQIANDLKDKFRMAGGLIFEGDEVVDATVEETAEGLKVTGVATAKLTDETLVADTYYLATGKFGSRGLRSNYAGAFEPIFRLDVVGPQKPSEWINDDFFAPQPFMTIHVATTPEGKALKDGKVIDNLYCIGAITRG